MGDVLLHVSGYLSYSDRMSALKVDQLFHRVIDSEKSWTLACQILGIGEMIRSGLRKYGITTKHLAKDVPCLLLKHEDLCAPLTEGDPDLIITAIKSIYQRDKKGKLTYASDPLNKREWVKNTFSLMVPRKNFSLDTLGKLMEAKHSIGYYIASDGLKAVFQKMGNSQISDSVLFLRKDMGIRSASFSDQKKISKDLGLTISTLTERIFFNFLFYLNTGKFLDGLNTYSFNERIFLGALIYKDSGVMGSDKHPMARTSTPFQDPNGAELISSIGGRYDVQFGLQFSGSSGEARIRSGVALGVPLRKV